MNVPIREKGGKPHYEKVPVVSVGVPCPKIVCTKCEKESAEPSVFTRSVELAGKQPETRVVAEVELMLPRGWMDLTLARNIAFGNQNLVRRVGAVWGPKCLKKHRKHLLALGVPDVLMAEILAEVSP